MSVADICLLVSVLVVVVVLTKMIRAIRLLEGRVSLLQEQLKVGRGIPTKAPANQRATPTPPSSRTPIAGVPIVPPSPSQRKSPVPETIPQDNYLPGESAPHFIEEAEAEAVWAKMEVEQERLRKAMGSDFRARTRKRSALDIRGKPVVRAMSSLELARRVEHK